MLWLWKGSWLFGSQGDDRVFLGCASGRDESGDGGKEDGDKNDDEGSQRSEVCNHGDHRELGVDDKVEDDFDEIGD